MMLILSQLPRELEDFSITDSLSAGATRRPRFRSLGSWLDVPPQAAIPHSADKNIATAIVNGADLRSTLS